MYTPNYYGSESDNYLTPVSPDQQQPYQGQQDSQYFVPGKDSANPETEEQRKARLTQQWNSYPIPSNSPTPTGGGTAQWTGAGSTPAPTTSSPMIAPNGSIPAGIPFSPTGPLEAKPQALVAPPGAGNGGSPIIPGQPAPTPPPAASAPAPTPAPIPTTNPFMPTAGTPTIDKFGNPFTPNPAPIASAGPVTDTTTQDRVRAGATTPQAQTSGGGGFNPQTWLDWIHRTYGPSASRGNGFADLPPGVNLADVIARFNQETGSHAVYEGGPSGDRVNFGNGTQDVLTSGGQLWWDYGSSGSDGAGGSGGRPGAGSGGSGRVGDTSPAPTIGPSAPTANYQLPQFTPYQFTPYSAPTTEGMGGLSELMQRLMAQGSPELDGLQNEQLKNMLTNPTYSQDYINKLNERQKELVLQQGQAERTALMQGAARRGVTDSGATHAADRRLGNNLTKDLLTANREVELNTTGANRQSLLDAISASQGVKASNAGIAQGNAGTYSNIIAQQGGLANQSAAQRLATESAQAGQNQAGFSNALAAANFGLTQDQFNAQTKQFDRNFIEQVRQFDRQLAQQMEQFNLSNQQGYDLANLASQNDFYNRLVGG